MPSSTTSSPPPGPPKIVVVNTAMNPQHPISTDPSKLIIIPPPQPSHQPSVSASLSISPTTSHPHSQHHAPPPSPNRYFPSHHHRSSFNNSIHPFIPPTTSPSESTTTTATTFTSSNPTSPSSSTSISQNNSKSIAVNQLQPEIFVVQDSLHQHHFHSNDVVIVPSTPTTTIPTPFQPASSNGGSSSSSNTTPINSRRPSSNVNSTNPFLDAEIKILNQSQSQSESLHHHQQQQQSKPSSSTSMTTPIADFFQQITQGSKFAWNSDLSQALELQPSSSSSSQPQSKHSLSRIPSNTSVMTAVNNNKQQSQQHSQEEFINQRYEDIQDLRDFEVGSGLANQIVGGGSDDGGKGIGSGGRVVSLKGKKERGYWRKFLDWCNKYKRPMIVMHFTFILFNCAVILSLFYKTDPSEIKPEHDISEGSLIYGKYLSILSISTCDKVSNIWFYGIFNAGAIFINVVLIVDEELHAVVKDHSILLGSSHGGHAGHGEHNSDSGSTTTTTTRRSFSRSRFGSLSRDANGGGAIGGDGDVIGMGGFGSRSGGAQQRRVGGGLQHQQLQDEVEAGMGE
ncbi:hypothetical protein HDU76_000942, partial [Blyttiomyces sp. JEL0837]